MMGSQYPNHTRIARIGHLSIVKVQFLSSRKHLIPGCATVTLGYVAIANGGKKIIHYPIEFFWLIQLQPVSCPCYHFMRKVGHKVVYTKRSFVKRCDDRQLWTIVTFQRRHRIIFQNSVAAMNPQNETKRNNSLRNSLQTGDWMRKKFTNRLESTALVKRLYGGQKTI